MNEVISPLAQVGDKIGAKPRRSHVLLGEEFRHVVHDGLNLEGVVAQQGVEFSVHPGQETVDLGRVFLVEFNATLTRAIGDVV